VLLIGVLVAPFAVPYLEARRDNPCFQRDITELYSYSADVTDFLVAPRHSLVWGAATGPVRPDPYTRGNEAERSLFTGLLPLLLSTGGIAFLWSRRSARDHIVLWFYGLLLISSAVLCLGVTFYAFGRHAAIWMPYRILYYAFPGFRAIRTPARIFVLVVLSLSVLTGFGVKWLRERLGRRLDPSMVTAIVVLVLLLVSLEGMPGGVPASSLPLKKDFPPP
jgi:O-antigen ligase